MDERIFLDVAMRLKELEKTNRRLLRYVENLERRLSKLHAASRFHFTDGTPGADLGADGDAALDYTGGVFYERVNSAWIARYTL